MDATYGFKIFLKLGWKVFSDQEPGRNEPGEDSNRYLKGLGRITENKGMLVDKSHEDLEYTEPIPNLSQKYPSLHDKTHSHPR
jgi:hypothetical protein